MGTAKRLLIILLLGQALAGCHRINPFAEGRMVARVGDKVLYDTDLGQFTAPGTTPEDSIRLLESYVDQWVRRQLKLDEAEIEFSGSEGEIEKLVEDYRRSLLIHRLDQRYISARLDTVCSDEDIRQYYEEHKGDFKLDRALVKGVVVRLPATFRQADGLRKLMATGGERYQDFVDISLKNDFALTEFPHWTDFSQLMALLPTGAQQEYAKLLSSRGVSEFRQGGDIYLVHIRESLRPGDTSPRERIDDIIRQTLLNRRKQEIIRTYEDSLTQAARERGEIEIKVY